MTFKDLTIPATLNTSDNNLVEDFFNPILSNAVKYDRGVGYFTSGWIRDAIKGMVNFASNHGKARWITSPILSPEDVAALIAGEQARENLIAKILLERSITDLAETLEKDTLRALAWMVADEIITFKIAKPKNHLTGEFHAKTGVFRDQDGNLMSFDGSYNDSIQGSLNYESIKVFRSWDSTVVYVEEEVEKFENLWNGNDPNISVVDFPEAVKEKLIQYRENSRRSYSTENWKEPPPFIMPVGLPDPQLPNEIELRDYQSEAISAWVDNGYQGIFEMATGTGKTITALSAVTDLIQELDKALILVACPYKHLVNQWAQEAERFGYRPVRVAESRSIWEESAAKALRNIKRGLSSQEMIITTISSYRKGSLPELLEQFDLDTHMIFVVDEVHHAGSQEMIKKLPEDAPWRLGLSATPIREYDEMGSEKILEFFNDIVYSFTLKDAIEGKFLTPYYYYPLPVEMTENEFSEFLELSNKLRRMHPDPDKPISDAALMIAIKRARVLNNSLTKLDWLRDNIENSDDFGYTLFYVGERIFPEVTKILGLEKDIPIHEFTHRQNNKTRSELLSRFSSGDIKVLVAMKCLDEGVDVPPTRKAYFLASSSVPREFIQRRGRILRNFPGKSYAYVHDLISMPPEDVLYSSKDTDEYKAARAAVRREYKRIVEFASLAENKYQALDPFISIADRLDLLDI